MGEAEEVNEEGESRPVVNPDPSTCVVAVLMACHNRREGTLECLRTLTSQDPQEVQLRVFITDDGSTDGTAEALGTHFPEVTVVLGDGTLYWAAGMALAEQQAIVAEPDFYLWLNDDTVLDPDALSRLLDVHRQHRGAIVVGAMRDPRTGSTTYGGFRRVGRHPLRLTSVPATLDLATVDTFNGNCVLIPSGVLRVIGGIDGAFDHALADLDYGYRANNAGITLVQCPGTIGTCQRHDRAVGRRSAREAWAFAKSRTGMPLTSQIRFMRRHGGRAWPVVVAWMQVRFFVKAMNGSV